MEQGPWGCQLAGHQPHGDSPVPTRVQERPTARCWAAFETTLPRTGTLCLTPSGTIPLSICLHTAALPPLAVPLLAEGLHHPFPPCMALGWWLELL